MIIIIITIINNMSNIFELRTLENKDFHYPLPRKYESVKYYTITYLIQDILPAKPFMKL